MSNTVSGVNSKWSCPEEGLCGRVMTEEDLEELQDEEGEEEERSVKLCRTGGGGGGWDGGLLFKGSSIAEIQQKLLPSLKSQFKFIP